MAIDFPDSLSPRIQPKVRNFCILFDFYIFILNNILIFNFNLNFNFDFNFNLKNISIFLILSLLIKRIDLVLLSANQSYIKLKHLLNFSLILLF